MLFQIIFLKSSFTRCLRKINFEKIAILQKSSSHMGEIVKFVKIAPNIQSVNNELR